MEKTSNSTLKSLVEHLLLRVSVLEEENSSLRQENRLLKEENEELRGRLNKTSKNSHKPPSTDGPKKQPALPNKHPRKVGGQKGHTGKTLEMVSEAQVDERIVHHAAQCSCCQRKFEVEDVESILQKRQVFDLPEPKLEIIEHQLGLISCCGQTHLGVFPSDVTGPVQYGNRVKAMVSLLNTEYRMPLEKISTLFNDLYEYNINENTIIRATEKCYEALERVENEIKTAITDSEVVHFDETGMRVAGKLHWFHTACTLVLSYIFVHTNRGKLALNDTKSVIKDFFNWAIHDCWSSYFEFSDASHALCNAHILRELYALIEKESVWAKKMSDFLFELYENTQKGTIILSNQAEWKEKYRKICEQAASEEPLPIKNPRGKPKNSKGRNLLNRLIKHQDAILAFAFHEAIPFTNNLAERDIRHVKVKQKVSMSFRTFHGAEVYARIQGFVMTTRKQKQNTFKELCAILNGQKYLFTTLPK